MPDGKCHNYFQEVEGQSHKAQTREDSTNDQNYIRKEQEDQSGEVNAVKDALRGQNTKTAQEENWQNPKDRQAADRKSASYRNAWYLYTTLEYLI